MSSCVILVSVLKNKRYNYVHVPLYLENYYFEIIKEFISSENEGTKA